MKFFTKTLLPLRTHLVTDNARLSLQGLLENAFEKTRQFLRVVCRKDIDLANTRWRYQHRLPSIFSPKNPQPTLPKRSNLISFQPGFIHKVTSRWASNSLAATLGKEAKRKLIQVGSGPMLCFVGFTLAKKPSLLTDEQELEGVSYEIREGFSHVPWKKFERPCTVENSLKEKVTFNDLCIGEMIAKGCNAAVYSAFWKNKNFDFEPFKQIASNSETSNDALNSSQKLIMPHSEGESLLSYSAGSSSCDINPPFSTGNLDPFDLAVKVMFNYSAESNAFAIWKAMYKETLPAMGDFTHNHLTSYKTRGKKNLPPHPNTVEMYCAFADQLPLLPGASINYPQALPLRLSSDGCGRNMTLFLVMKRYHCSLKDYLKTHNPTTRTSLLLFTQVLEALVHLLQNDVCHRDLKTDNILLDLTHGLSSPALAITDFGCCLESLKLSYPNDDIDKGGNMALMAPEIVNAETGPFSVINYSRSDLWTAGTLAYEIFGGSNPFYSGASLKPGTYKMTDLPSLPPKTPTVVKKLVKDMLQHDPKLRPRQSLAATVCQLLLHAPPELLRGPYCKKTYKKVFDWMFEMAAETFLQASVEHLRLNSIEFQLRFSFCSRIQFSEVLEALCYILDD